MKHCVNTLAKSKELQPNAQTDTVVAATTQL